MAVGRGSVFTAGTQLGYRLTGNPERHLSVLHFEEQILGQVRLALKLAQEQGILGRILGDLGRLALRAGSLLQALGVGCNAPVGAYTAGLVSCGCRPPSSAAKAAGCCARTK